MLYRFAFLFITLTVGFACQVSAQEEDPIRIDSTIVRLNVGVVDNRGHPVVDLDKSNFSVFEDGIKQQITKFEPSTAPFSVVMILDMSGSTITYRQVMKQAAFRFIDALTPNDRVAVVEFYDKINLRNDFTSDRRTIAHSIAVADGRGQTQFFKALEFSLNKLAKEQARRKAIIVLSDGIDTSAQDKDRDSLRNLGDDKIPSAVKAENNDQLNRVLQKSDTLGVTIYPLALPTGDPTKLADPTPRQFEMYRAARARLKIVADRSGGTLNTINHLEDMGRLYAEVAADLRTLYTVEYQPSNDKRDGKFRSIRIDVANPDLISRTRQGYYAK